MQNTQITANYVLQIPSKFTLTSGNFLASPSIPATSREIVVGKQPFSLNFQQHLANVNVCNSNGNNNKVLKTHILFQHHAKSEVHMSEASARQLCISPKMLQDQPSLAKILRQCRGRAPTSLNKSCCTQASRAVIRDRFCVRCGFRHLYHVLHANRRCLVCITYVIRNMLKRVQASAGKKHRGV